MTATPSTLAWLGDSLSIRIEVPGASLLTEEQRNRLAYRLQDKVIETAKDLLARQTARVAPLVTARSDTDTVVPRPPEEPTP